MRAVAGNFLLALLATLVVAFATATLAQERTVNIYNWSDYIDPAVLKDFEARHWQTEKIFMARYNELEEQLGLDGRAIRRERVAAAGLGVAADEFGSGTVEVDHLERHTRLSRAATGTSRMA